MTPLRRRLIDGERLLGSLMLLSDPAVVEIYGLAGWDFVLIDVEHGTPSPAALPDLLRAGAATGIGILARAPASAVPSLLPWLDAGLGGLLLTGVTEADRVEKIVRELHHPPSGVRSVNPFVRSAGYGALGIDALVAREDAFTLWLMAETTGDEVSHLASVPGVDAVVVGPYDLSARLGLPGQTDHPRVLREMERIFDLVQRAGTACGLFAASPAAVPSSLVDACQVQVLGVDADLLRRALLEARLSVEGRREPYR